MIRPQANLDLLQIWHHIAEDRPQAASRLIDEIDAACNELCERPDAGRPLPAVRDNDVLFYRVGLYYIAYRVKPDVIVIDRVIHGARRVARVYRSGE